MASSPSENPFASSPTPRRRNSVSSRQPLSSARGSPLSTQASFRSQASDLPAPSTEASFRSPASDLPAPSTPVAAIFRGLRDKRQSPEEFPRTPIAEDYVKFPYPKFPGYAQVTPPRRKATKQAWWTSKGYNMKKKKGAGWAKMWVCCKCIQKGKGEAECSYARDGADNIVRHMVKKHHWKVSTRWILGNEDVTACRCLADCSLHRTPKLWPSPRPHWRCKCTT